MNLVVIEVEELEKLIRQIVREELRGFDEEDETGGVEFAAKITGFKVGTIYKKVQHREIPFRQESKGCKVTFSKNELIKWKANQR